MARSINQNAYAGALPNFRNLGIMLRMLVIVNMAAAAAAIVKSPNLLAAWRQFIETSALVEPLLILSLLVLAALSNVLRRIPYWIAAIVVLAVELALATALYYFAWRILLGDEPSPLERYWALVALTTVALLAYFNLRERALSPALSEARLQALQARIRPHFLFNSINAVLSLIRKEPQRAEATLEDMADLFRVLMADNRELTSLAREIELCRQYVGIEQLRLGERLQVNWQLDAMPRDALVPPLVLQPLLENAVYHGIEPRSEPGTISIHVYAVHDELHAVLRNPYREASDHHAGNRMALANIRERLALHFDAEARLSVKASDDAYEVRIVMPYIKSREP